MESDLHFHRGPGGCYRNGWDSKVYAGRWVSRYRVVAKKINGDRLEKCLGAWGVRIGRWTRYGLEEW